MVNRVCITNRSKRKRSLSSRLSTEKKNVASPENVVRRLPQRESRTTRNLDINSYMFLSLSLSLPLVLDGKLSGKEEEARPSLDHRRSCEQTSLSL